MNLGVDASNIITGGGIVHLKEIFENFSYLKNRFDRIILWGNPQLLKKIRKNKKIKKINIEYFSNNLIKRFYWNFFLLPKELKSKNCDLLFSPGGLIFRKSIKTVTLCQNLHPFEFNLKNTYGISIFSLRLIILNFLMKLSFKKSDGIIFLTKYAKDKINSVLKLRKKKQIIIPHGINPIFKYQKKFSQHLSKFSNKKKINLIYVSTVEPYKNHINLITAVRDIKIYNLEINLNLIGKIHPRLNNKFMKVLNENSSKNIFINYLGYVEHNKIHKYYNNADIGVFASSCENMPCILIEMMKSKLPIACSKIGPMKEILKDGGLYFDPYNSKSISSCIKKLILNEKLRSNISVKAEKYSKKFSWNTCSINTFNYLYKIAKSNENIL
jgi:glycosyltransferase involved in cell wall biosynthesis